MAFDHETAWHKAAKPTFDNLAPEVRALFDHVCEVAKSLHQDKNCDMIWPEDGGDLRARFEVFDDLTLAVAAHATYFYGHWSPEGTAEKTAGGTWKFTSYADQVLRARLGAGRDVKGNGSGVMILDGALRVGVSTPWSWTWEEIAPATATNIARVREVIAKHKAPEQRSDRSTWTRFEDAVMKSARTLRTELSPQGDSPLALLFDASKRFDVPEEELKARREARRQVVKDATHNVNRVAEAIVAITRAEEAIYVATGRADKADDMTVEVQHKISLLFIKTGTSPSFNAKAMAIADEHLFRTDKRA